MSDIKQVLLSFIHDLSDIPANDALVNIDFESKKVVELATFTKQVFTLPFEGALRSIYKNAQDAIRETDVNTLCIVDSFISWIKNEGEVQTPLILHPVQAKYRKLNSDVQFTPADEAEINPYFKWLWRDWTNEDLPFFDSSEELIGFLNKEIVLKQLPVSISEKYLIGNFHYHRFHVLRELEGIQKQTSFSNPLKQILGESIFVTEEKSAFTKYNLLPSDQDQQQLLKELEIANCVLEGPPGTGKTQVLVNLLGKILYNKETVLLVSEKKAALDVVLKKLAAFQLNHFAVSISSQTSKTDFVKKLESTWVFLESQTIQEEKNLFLSENYSSNLALLFNRLNDKTTFQGLDFSRFYSLLQEYPNEPKEFSTQICTLSEWLEFKPNLEELEQNLGSLQIIKQFSQAFYQLKHPDEILGDLNERLKKVKLHFSIETLADLENLVAKIGRAQLLENDLYDLYCQFEGKPKLIKNFESKIQELEKATANCANAKEELRIWKQIPTKAQYESWKAASSFFQKRKVKKVLNENLKDSSILHERALETIENYYITFEKLQLIEAYFSENKFSTNLIELKLEQQFLRSLLKEDSIVLTELKKWKKEDRKALLTFGNDLEYLSKSFYIYFHLESSSSLDDLLKQSVTSLQVVYPFWNSLSRIPASISKNLSYCSNSKELEAFIVHSNWKLIQARYPELARFKPADFSTKLDVILSEQELEQAWFARTLIQQQLATFKNYESILRTSSTKLSADEKELRKNLKKGKAILVNEFSKSRSHKSIREFLSTEARTWISCLLPIWLTTPTQVADNFPLVKELFDWSLFDEASQIPLPNAFGSLYRSKQTLIAGDQQQMSPTTYFGKNYTFPDLMHQSSYYFTNLSLSYHYRSTHPDLIDFSNRYFYNSRLHVFPSPKLKIAVEHHFVENGQYIERKNKLEAEAIAQFLETVNWKKSIGLVAFSEEQLSCILAACSQRVLDELEKQTETNKGFVKALEKIQGDEADCLVIGFGYGKSETGEFAKRFGPVNQVDGHKRLNVLFSRAKETIHFFTSVKSSDFQLSENEAVNLLKKWFLFSENEDRKTEISTVPFHLEHEIKANTIAIKNVSGTIESVEDLLTFHQIMKNRNWIINYI